VIEHLEGQMALDLDGAKAKVETRVYPRVSESSIKAKIKSTSFFITENLLTVCVLEMRNGFSVVGKAAAADPRNYDREVGKRYAYEDAFRQIWPLEGYLLKDTIWKAEQLLGDDFAHQGGCPA
jgi:hypothetical protein